jgi:RHS repeat-associated protein
LVRLTTTRGSFPANQQTVQDLAYSYDPVGNITHIQDDADIQNVVFFRNQRVEPGNDYIYDAIYRLIQASGREQLGLGGDGKKLPPTASSYNDVPRIGLTPTPGDGNAVGRYKEQYQYDHVGNFLQFIHKGPNPADPGWTRTYTYTEPSLLEPGKVSNRLSQTAVSGNLPFNEPYTHDVHGNMTSMPQLQAMQWNFKDELLMTRRQAVNATDADGVLHQGERTYYVYDASGHRARKVTESPGGIKTKERFYLGGFEVYREYDSGGAVSLERETLHVMDDKRRVALVETCTQGSDGSPAQLMRYQFSNHLGSASLELDDASRVISYEEYYPYGNTSYQAGRSAIEAKLKRYRYTGMERDEESGLNYHAARYYAPWLGGWTSCDPVEKPAESNLYSYAFRNPIVHTDELGTDPDEPSHAKRLHYATDTTVTKDTFNVGAPPAKDKEGPKLLGFDVAADFSRLSWNSGGLASIPVGFATTLEVHQKWSPEPFRVDLVLTGTGDVPADTLESIRRGPTVGAIREWLSGKHKLQGRLKLEGSAILNLDFEISDNPAARFIARSLFGGARTLGILRIATPVKIEADARLASSGLRLSGSVEYGSWYHITKENYHRFYSLSGMKMVDERISKSTGVQFFDRPDSPPTTDPLLGLRPSRQYQTGPGTQADPSSPDPEGRLQSRHRIGWEQYVGVGTSITVERMGKSRFEASASAGITVGPNYLPNGGAVTGVLKYEWW